MVLQYHVIKDISDTDIERVISIIKKFIIKKHKIMTILITGITGMVGSHLLDFLIKNTDEKIIGISRWRSPLNNISQHIPTYK